MHHREEVKRELLEAHCDASVAFDALEEVLDEMSLFVERAINRALLFAVRSRRDHDVARLADELFDEQIRIVSLVRQNV